MYALLMESCFVLQVWYRRSAPPDVGDGRRPHPLREVIDSQVS